MLLLSKQWRGGKKSKTSNLNSKDSSEGIWTAFKFIILLHEKFIPINDKRYNKYRIYSISLKCGVTNTHFICSLDYKIVMLTLMFANFILLHPVGSLEYLKVVTLNLFLLFSAGCWSKWTPLLALSHVPQTQSPMCFMRRTALFSASVSQMKILKVACIFIQYIFIF